MKKCNSIIVKNGTKKSCAKSIVIIAIIIMIDEI